MVPLALDGCRAWYHPGKRRAGVVLCGALGIEELCARQSYTILAKCLEKAGIPTIRLDYYGTADSAGDLNEPGLALRWLRNIEVAARWLEVNAGATELTFVGLRFGATLATVAASARGGVARLVLLAPVVSGRAYARELQLASRVLETMGSEPSMTHNPGPGTDVAGFVYPPDLIASFRDIDIAKLNGRPAHGALLLSPAGADTAEPVAAHLSSIGVTIEQRAFADFKRMMINPTSGHPCVSTAQTVADWIVAAATVTEGSKSKVPVQDESITGDGWRETAAVYPIDDYRCGILCEPDVVAPDTACALLLNGGRDSHVGWARGNVELARQMAREGIATLRFDLTHVADSQPDTHGIRAKLYAPGLALALADVRRAVDMAENHGYRRFAVFGSCSGAYLAFKAGLAEPRIDTIALRNIQRFVWRLDDRLLFPHDERRDSTVGSRARSAEVTTAADRAQLVRTIKSFSTRHLRRAIYAMSNAVSLALFDRRRTRNAIAAFKAHGGRLLVVYSANDIGRPHLDQLLGKDGRLVEQNAAFHFEHGADHNFTSAARRHAFGDMLIKAIARTDA